MTNAQKFIQTLKEMTALVKSDISNGHPWKYSNTTSKKKKNFDDQRASFGKNGKKCSYCNCVDGVQWALKRAGLVGSDGLSWYGQQGTGMAWLGSNAKSNAKKYFIVKQIKTKTVKQLKASGELQPGDIVTYMSMSHTNVYLGSKWFDSGHATCTKSGQDAPYKASGWICSKNYDNYKVGYILRLKETKKYVYRVRLGIFSIQQNAINKQNYMKTKKYDTFRELQPDGWHVYCGSFENKTKANEKVAELAKKKIPAAIETVEKS